MKTKEIIENTFDKFLIWHRRRVQIKKFKNKRRVAIYSTLQLSDGQKKEVLDFFRENYGEKIPLTWHRHYTAFTGHFDKAFFPELLYIPEFEHFMNLWPEYAKVFADKNVLPLLAERADVRMPKTILSCTKGMLRDSHDYLLHSIPEIGGGKMKIFAKPTVNSCSGKGCRLLLIENGKEKETGMSVTELCSTMGDDFVFQEVQKCHESISAINPSSVNTFRVITYRWKNKIEHTPSIMRIGQGGSHLDNAHAGGMFIAIDDDGKLHEKAITEFRKEYQQHPDTGYNFANGCIPLFPKVLKAAKRMHMMMPQIGVVNWDFTIDEDGCPVLIEANLEGGSIWLIEMAHGCAPFGERTAEILQWMRKMKKTKASDRPKYAFGN